LTSGRSGQESNDSADREAALFARLRELLSNVAPNAPALARQLAGVDIASLKTPADLARVPVLRKSELQAMQEASPPFGGLAATNPAFLKRLMVSPGPIFEPEGHGADWWGATQALSAAGFRAGDLVLNCFSYHLSPGGHIMESGALALGCAVIPAGPGNTEQQLEARSAATFPRSAMRLSRARRCRRAFARNCSRIASRSGRPMRRPILE
jgi:phenylacetate-CoA ligase